LGSSQVAVVCNTLSLTDEETLIVFNGSDALTVLTTLALDVTANTWYGGYQNIADSRAMYGSALPLSNVTTTGALGGGIAVPVMVTENPTTHIIYVTYRYTAGGACAAGCVGVKAYDASLVLTGTNNTVSLDSAGPSGVGRDTSGIYVSGNATAGVAGVLTLYRFDQTTLGITSGTSGIGYGLGNTTIVVDTFNDKLYQIHRDAAGDTTIARWTASTTTFDTSFSLLLNNPNWGGVVINSTTMYYNQGSVGARLVKATTPNLTVDASVTYAGETVGVNSIVYDTFSNKIYTAQINAATTDTLVRRINPTTLATEDTLTLAGFTLSSHRNQMWVDSTNHKIYLSGVTAGPVTKIKRLGLCV
jgi:hypothetical protein